jgi:uncharacterized repeat protein (TIGR03943 family)
VRRDAQAGVCLLLAATALRLGLTDAALAYVKPSLRPLLVAAGVVLLVVGVAGLRSRPADDRDHPAPSAAWLLVLPVVAVFLIAPAPLGTYAAERQSASRQVERVQVTSPLPAEVDGAVPLGMRDFLLRVVNGTQLEGVRVRLTGFLTTDAKGVVLNRFRVTCCAADGIAMRTRLEGIGGLAEGTWVTVEGQVAAGTRDAEGALVGLPVLEVSDWREVPAPSNPYEV